MKNKEYSDYIHQSRYARYRDDLGRRETWDETVDRVRDFWLNRSPKKVHLDITDAMEAVRRKEVMPSMRVMMTAGPALEDHQVAGYNCAYTTINNMRKFSEILYVLMCGTGVGFSVERDYVRQLPELPEDYHESDTTIKVRDSKLGWAAGYRELIQMLCGGRVPQWNLDGIRPEGARLKTFGGRASGPRPLDELFRFTVATFKAAAGRRLTPIECHDIVCKIADIVVVGGVRRSALISLSNLSDDRMRHAKSGEWFETDGHRRLANNSVAYTSKPDMAAYLREITSLYESKAGERGLFSRTACQAKYDETHRRDGNHEFGTNPCSEIILRPDQFCNLSEIILRPEDDVKKVLEKARHATILGTLQSGLTDFKFLSSSWTKNCEEERLLGVSITGILDHAYFNDVNNPHLPRTLNKVRDHVIQVNKEIAKKLGIEQSTATTCVKPSGTVSQLCDTASGIHPRYSSYYIRRVLSDNKDPLCQFLKDAGVPWEDSIYNDTTTVFEFPIEAPETALTTDDITAVDHLKLWQLYNDEWCEHKPSVTLQYTDENFMEVATYIYEHFDKISGIALLPRTDSIYAQAPYEKIDRMTYKLLANAMPKELDWSKLVEYENEDNTTVQPELACTAGACEL